MLIGLLSTVLVGVVAGMLHLVSVRPGHTSFSFLGVQAAELPSRSQKGAEVIRRLKRNGWVLRNVRGSHHQFVPPEEPGRVTVKHPSKQIPHRHSAQHLPTSQLETGGALTCDTWL